MNQIRLAILIFAGSALTIASCARPPQETLPLPLLDAETAYLSDFDGRVVALYFWASWCPPCRTEMPIFQSFYEEYGDLGLVILGVNLRETEPTVRSYTQEMGVTYPIVLDRNGEIAQHFRVVGPPVTILIDGDGEVVRQFVGEVTRDQLSEFIDPMMVEER